MGGEEDHASTLRKESVSEEKVKKKLDVIAEKVGRYPVNLVESLFS